MVDPNVVRSKDGDAVTVRAAAVANVRRRAADCCRPGLLVVMDVHAVDDDVAHVLQRDAAAASDVHVRTPPVDRLVAVDNELVLEANVHVSREDDPQRPVLEGAIAERPRRRVDHVVVAVIGHHIDRSILAADRVLAESNRAIRKRLPILPPVRIASPAVVDGVALAAPGQQSPCVVVTGRRNR